MQKDAVRSHFDSIATVYAGQYKGDSPIGHLLTERQRWVRELTKDIHGARVLDLGCGPGYPAEYYISRDCQYLGIDLSLNMLRESASRSVFSQRAYLASADLMSLPLEDSSFDLVLCLGVLEYVVDIGTVIETVSKILKSRGVFVLSMQNLASPYRWWDRYVYTSGTVLSIKKTLNRPVSADPTLKLVRARDVKIILCDHGLAPDDAIFYDFNLWMPPFDRFFPKISVATTRRLEYLSHSRMKRLGTGFIIKAQKRV